MNDENRKNRLIRLRNYKAIKAGGKAAQKAVEDNWGKIPLNKYWEVFLVAYDEYITNHPVDFKEGAMEKLAFLISDEAQAAKHVKKFRYGGIFIISDNSVSPGLIWAAENRIPSLTVCFDRFEKEEGSLNYSRVACSKTHAIAEYNIVEFLKKNNISGVIPDGFGRELSAEFRKALNVSGIHFINF